MKVVILGAGPTGLSAAWRLQEHGHQDWTLLEASDRPGGLAMSVRDDAGFTWDLGGHVLFSHWKYFDRLLEQALGDHWVEHQREAWVWMRERWIPYPFQNNIWRLPDDELVRCLTGLVDVHRASHDAPPADFGEWLQRSFGEGLCETFMYPYNRKVWAYPPSELGVGWMGERVATVDLARILANVVERRDDVSWGPNATFRFPLRGGTGAIWTSIASQLPYERINLCTRVSGIDTAARRLICDDGTTSRLRPAHLYHAARPAPRLPDGLPRAHATWHRSLSTRRATSSVSGLPASRPRTSRRSAGCTSRNPTRRSTASRCSAIIRRSTCRIPAASGLSWRKSVNRPGNP